MYLYYLLIICVVSLRNSFALDVARCSNSSVICDDQKQCIWSSQWCDKKEDCEDKSDEKYCKILRWFTSDDPNNCESSPMHFKCDNGICIPKSALCDGYDNCADGADEYSYNCEITSDVSTSDATTKRSTTINFDYEMETDEDWNSSLETKDGQSTEPDSSEETNSFSSLVEITTKTSAQPPSTVPQRAILTSSTVNYYDKRMKEGEVGQASQTPRSSIISTKAPAPQQPTRASRHHQPNYPDPTVGQPVPVHMRHPNSHHRRPVTIDPHSDIRSRAFDYRPPAHTVRPPTYENRSPNYDSRSTPYDRRSPNYDSRSPRYDSRYATPQNNRAYYNGVHVPNFPNRSYQRTDRHSYNANHRESENGWREEAPSRTYHRETQVKERFHFANDYADRFSSSNELPLRDAQSWLLRQRRPSGDWGKYTGKALIALALVNNSFPSGDSDYELMKRNFIVQLSVELLRNNSKSLSVNRLASAINALWAVCENPTDFNGIDLAELLRKRVSDELRGRTRINPFVTLSMCVAGKRLSSGDIHLVMKQMVPTSALDEMSKDTQSMAIQTFACYLHQQHNDVAYKMSLQEVLNNAVAKLLERMLEDGSFGSVYSTALATQALLSVNDSLSWDAEKTMKFLREQQLEDGSFGDLLATYYVIPALSGRSLMHLRNTRCQRLAKVRELSPAEILEFNGPKQYIHYSIYFGYPLENSHSVRIQVPVGINFFDVMRVAHYQDKDFKFEYQLKERRIHVYSLSGVPNDAERGLSWHLYVKQESDPRPQQLNPSELYTGDLKEFLPTSVQHVIFWYHPQGVLNIV